MYVLASLLLHHYSVIIIVFLIILYFIVMWYVFQCMHTTGGGLSLSATPRAQGDVVVVMYYLVLQEGSDLSHIQISVSGCLST